LLKYPLHLSLLFGISTTIILHGSASYSSNTITKNKNAMINPLGVMAIVVPLLLLSSIGFGGYNSNLSIVKYALAQQGSNKTNTMSNMSNLATPTTKTATTTNVTSRYPPFVTDILSVAKQNNNFRKEINTADQTQVVLMSLKPGEDIGLEVHKKIDQILVFVQGTGDAIIGVDFSEILI
jgi:hypothetical protein